MWRPNTGSPAGWQQGLPDVSMTQLAEDFRFVADNHCIGLFVDSVWEHWATQGPQYYLMAQLAWNPRIDDRAVLDDYYRRAFGPAAEHVKAYFSVFETARQAHVAEHGGREGLSKFTELYTADLLKRMLSIRVRFVPPHRAWPDFIPSIRPANGNRSRNPSGRKIWTWIEACFSGPLTKPATEMPDLTKGSARHG